MIALIGRPENIKEGTDPQSYHPYIEDIKVITKPTVIGHAMISLSRKRNPFLAKLARSTYTSK